MNTLDDEAKSDLMDAFHELHQEAESCITSLLEYWDVDIVNKLFRAVHNVKGNAGMMSLSSIVDFTHQVEEVADALRKQRFTLTHAIAEVLLIGFDRIHDLHQTELYGKKFDFLRIDELQNMYHALATSQGEDVPIYASKILKLVGAGIDGCNEAVAIIAAPSHTARNTTMAQGESIEKLDSKLTDDLLYFQTIGLKLDEQFFDDPMRCLQFYDWAMKMNSIADNPVNIYQLAAAVYLHDFGMLFLPQSMNMKIIELSNENNGILHEHVTLGRDFVERIPGWDAAAEIILQHHERLDGSGFPKGLTDRQIHPGAKIIAILDTFFSLTKGSVNASARKSTVRALSYINTRIDTEFDGMWVQCFNHVVRKELEAGNI